MVVFFLRSAPVPEIKKKCAGLYLTAEVQPRNPSDLSKSQRIPHLSMSVCWIYFNLTLLIENCKVVVFGRISAAIHISRTKLREKISWKQIYYLDQRFLAALEAISERFAADRALALAAPPLVPPATPLVLMRGLGDCPVAILITSKAIWLKSRFIWKTKVKLFFNLQIYFNPKKSN